MKAFRKNEIVLSDEVNCYLKLDAKLACQGTTAIMTRDEMADCQLRSHYSATHPEWVIKWAEMETARQQAKDRYHQIEKSMMEAVKP